MASCGVISWLRKSGAVFGREGGHTQISRYIWTSWTRPRVWMPWMLAIRRYDAVLVPVISPRCTGRGSQRKIDDIVSCVPREGGRGWRRTKASRGRENDRRATKTDSIDWTELDCDREGMGRIPMIVPARVYNANFEDSLLEASNETQNELFLKFYREERMCVIGR